MQHRENEWTERAHLVHWLSLVNHKCRTASSLLLPIVVTVVLIVVTLVLLLLVGATGPDSSRVTPVKSTISSWSKRSSSEPVVVAADCVDWCDPDDSCELREKDPLRGAARERWLAGFTVMMRFELLANIMSVT